MLGFGIGAETASASAGPGGAGEPQHPQRRRSPACHAAGNRNVKDGRVFYIATGLHLQVTPPSLVKR